MNDFAGYGWFISVSRCEVFSILQKLGKIFTVKEWIYGLHHIFFRL